ncbi:MAG: HD domain-containing protein [Bacteroidetes bacterium]|nr:HD domain-containing protein [Bacteroidota bacterium]
MVTTNIIQTANEIMYLYERYGTEDYIGEPVSQIEHMCQCAQLAEASGADDELILAAFFHDIGHLCEYAFPEKKLTHMEGVGLVDHEKLGANYLLSKGFSSRIAKLVQSHVAAKRYLTYHFPEYYDRLSEASKITLGYQGGKMTHDEALQFESDPLFDQYIAIRRWDDQGKTTDQPLPDLSYYRQMIIEHLTQQNN